jgi:hypothetical protein
VKEKGMAGRAWVEGFFFFVTKQLHPAKRKILIPEKRRN